MSEAWKSPFNYHYWRVKDTKFNFKKDKIYLSFTKASNSDYSRFISLVTMGPYSHVDLVINGKRYTALTHDGVQEYDLNPDDLVTVFRLDERQFDIRKIKAFFKRTEGNKYSYRNAAIGRTKLKVVEQDAFMCSQWVSNALDEAYTGNLEIDGKLLKDIGYHTIDPNSLFRYIVSHSHLLKKDNITSTPWAESCSYMSFGEKYEINKGIYELYGPREKEFTDKKHIVSLCYRLMWNLKNTNKIKEFDEIESIYFDSVKGKPYAMIVCNDGRKFIFYLGYVYTPIPSEFNDKEIIVNPQEHNINIYVNTKGDSLQDEIRMIQTGRAGNERRRSSWLTKKEIPEEVNIHEDEPKTEEEALLENEKQINAEKVEELVDETKDVINPEDEATKEKIEIVDKIKETFEDKIVKGLIKKGILKGDN